MKLKIQQALIYPVLMIFVSFGIITFLLTYVIPKIIAVFKSTGQALPQLTVFLIDLSQGLKHYGVFIIIALIALFFIARHVLKFDRYRMRYHQMLLKLPFIAYLIKTINTARFAHTLSILSIAGVPMLNAIRVSSNLVTNLAMKDALVKATKKIKDGRNIHQALKETQMFSAMTIHLIASGESSGTLEEMLHRAAITQDKEIETLINTGLTLLEPMIILIMGGFVLFIVLATLLPIFAMNQLVN